VIARPPLATTVFARCAFDRFTSPRMLASSPPAAFARAFFAARASIASDDVDGASRASARAIPGRFIARARAARAALARASRSRVVSSPPHALAPRDDGSSRAGDRAIALRISSDPGVSRAER